MYVVRPYLTPFPFHGTALLMHPPTNTTDFDQGWAPNADKELAY